MAKKNVVTKRVVTKACRCSTCGQTANAVEGSVHFYCSGFSFEIPAALKGRMSNPSKKGVWAGV